LDVDAAMFVGLGVAVGDDDGATGDEVADGDGTATAGVDDADGTSGAAVVGVADADGAPPNVEMTTWENVAVDVPAHKPPAAHAPVASMLAALPDALDRYAIGTMPTARLAAIVARKPAPQAASVCVSVTVLAPCASTVDTVVSCPAALTGNDTVTVNGCCVLILNPEPLPYADAPPTVAADVVDIGGGACPEGGDKSSRVGEA